MLVPLNVTKLPLPSTIAQWPEYRLPWLVLASSATILVLVALWFQYRMDLQPCVQCIYQRTAMIGLALAGWVGFAAPGVLIPRLIGFAGWLISAGAGFASAHHHIWLQSASNPLFTTCSPYPDFPSWLPLHEWIPGLFAAGGMCTQVAWEWLGMSMPEWLRIIFAVYFVIGIAVIAIRIAVQRKI